MLTTQFIDACKVNGLPHGGADKYVTKILAIMASERNHLHLIKQLEEIVWELTHRVSIGMALESLSNLGHEGDSHDGLDALTYTLSSNCCEKGIKALQMVMKRFADDSFSR